jgi:hypothetical protein
MAVTFSWFYNPGCKISYAAVGSSFAPASGTSITVGSGSAARSSSGFG